MIVTTMCGASLMENSTFYCECVLEYFVELQSEYSIQIIDCLTLLNFFQAN